MKTVFPVFLLLALLLVVLVLPSPLFAQPTSAQSAVSVGIEQQPTVLLNVLSYKGETADSHRVDVYCMIPYQILQFVRANERYGAQYALQITVRDSSGNRVSDKKVERNVVEMDYDVSRGSTGKSDISQSIFKLKSGVYKIEVLVSDALSNREYTNGRKVTVPLYASADASMSSIMLVSSIEQRGERYVITPHLNDNVSNLSDGFFLFFEVYNAKGTADSLDFACEVYDANNKNVFTSARQRMDVHASRSQQYMRVVLPTTLVAGFYTLRVVGVAKNAPQQYTAADYVVRSERTIQIERGIAGSVLNDLDKAIRQMRYVASQTDIDSINSAASAEEKRTRFENFWKQLDPSPYTVRNEAFEEYYGRIEYANKNFRSYNDGWLTDMGMVYIILGPPSGIDRQVNRVDGRSVIVWNYVQNNRRFLFIDNSGFGDYRASPSTPIPYNEKYRYAGS